MDTPDAVPSRARSTDEGAPTRVPLTDSMPPVGAETVDVGAGTVPAIEPTAVVNVAGYVVDGVLGRGGMGVVYKARQAGLNRTVALKMILHADHAGTEDRLRFLREAETLAKLRHEYIVQVYEVGEHEGKPFISLEFVDGGSLDKLLAGTPLPAHDAAALVEKLARGMQAAHNVGIIHRDLKPANVLLDMERGAQSTESEAGESRSALRVLRSALPKITDFGLAKNVAEKGQTQSGAIMGTPSYMAPEQAGGKGKELDARADIYALGAILYECLTGRPPFRAATALDTVLQVMNEEPVAPSKLDRSVPRDVETVCLKCLQKEPGKRYQSAAELGDDLGRVVRGEPVRARPVGPIERTWRWCRRNPALAGLATTIVLVLAAGAIAATVLALVANRNAEEAAQKAGDEKKERERAEGLLYSSRLALSQQYWNDNNVAAAVQLLEAAEEHRNEWEHRYLYALMRHRRQRTFRGYEGWVLFSPDGRRLASVGEDAVKVWDAQSGQELLTLKRRPHVLTSVCFSSDSRRLAAATEDGVKAWDALSCQHLLTLKGHTGAVSSVCFSPDGRRLASGAGRTNEPGEVKVWDAHSGQELLTLRVPTGFVSSVWFSPDGRRIASASGIGISASGDGIRVWDAQSGQELLALNASFVCFSPDGRRLASQSKEGIKVWDAQSGQHLLTLRGALGLCEFSPDGQRFASVYDERVEVWDAQSGHELLTLKARHRVTSVCFSPDGRRLAAGLGEYQRTGAVEMWDVQSGQNLLTLKGHTHMVTSVCFSPDGRRLASASMNGEVKVWDAQSDEDLLAMNRHTDVGKSVCFSPDGRRLASQGAENTVKVWDVQSGQDMLVLTGHTSPVTSVCFSPDGRRLASAAHDNAVRVWDAQTGRMLLTLTGHTQGVNSVCFSPDGRRLASGGGAFDKPGEVTLWDSQSGQELLRLKGHLAEVTSVCFNPNGRRLASGSNDETVKVWDAQSGQELLTLKELHRVTSVCFSPDGRRLASARWDRTVKVWDAESGEDLVTLKGHTEAVTSVCYSPDGRRLASGSYDLTVKVWDAQSGQDLLTLKGHASPMTSVCFSPDGRRIASADSNFKLKVWDAPQREDLGPEPWWFGTDHPWHEQRLREAQSAGDWLAADFHLARLILARPWDAVLQAQRGYVLSRLGKPADAVAHYVSAIVANPSVPLWPLDANAATRGAGAARASDKARATLDFALAAAQPHDDPNWTQRDQFLAQLASGQPDAARRTAAAMLKRFEADRVSAIIGALISRNVDGVLAFIEADQYSVENLISGVTDGPCNEATATRLVQLAEGLVTSERSGSHLHYLGTARYRAGRWQAAADALEESLKVHGDGGLLVTHLFLAMARQRLGQGEAARSHLAIFERWLKKQDFKEWQDQTRWWLLHEEARALIYNMLRAPD